MILIAAFGNVLRCDDGYGVYLLQRLQRSAWPDDVVLHEAGIGGISMVQLLMSPCSALIVLDAFEQGEVGEVRVVEVSVDDARLAATGVPRDYLADIHYVEPAKAIALARGLDVLPEHVFLVGAVGRNFDLGESLSPDVEATLERGEAKVRDLVATLRRLIAS
ncbi:MAG: hydrogenase maturation protease [Planctomycetota bacterium]